MARQALAVARDNPEVLRLAGYALAGLAGENETALTALDRAIELNPNYALAYAQRGVRPDLAQPARRGDRRRRAGDPLKPERSDRLRAPITRWASPTSPPAATRRPCRGPIVRGAEMPAYPRCASS